MTIGIGGSTQQIALAKLHNMAEDVLPIQLVEYQQRIRQAQYLMKQNSLQAIYLNAGTNLSYFTGTFWYASERLVGAILCADGNIEYIVPDFEVATIRGFIQIEGTIHSWQEDEDPYQLVVSTLHNLGVRDGKVGIDESTAFFISDGLSHAGTEIDFVSAKNVTAGCRMIKSAKELSLMQRAMEMTLEVHKAVASILTENISTQEVTEFIDKAHQKVGASGSSFCIVLFGQDTSFPHGVKSPKPLQTNDMVLIDTGCLLYGYNSDITRTYVFGVANKRQREIWAIEKAAQASAFDKAQIGLACGEVDIAARETIASHGLGPDYQVPGLPHRTGHGIGLDIHEWPYLVKNDTTPLAAGMCFSNEPMLVIPGEFGVRLEDHFYMTEQGPKWFTEPSHSIDDPFAGGKSVY